ncbi:MAG: hypothetical protein DMG96_29170 [Acidobacteria bacterium]|nr:MAG: hypothetical protein DMG96_29170 [Acidobacteriota bacterium]
MFLTAVIFLAVIELWRPRGAGFDTPLFWIPVAMINFLRIRNGYRALDGLSTFAIVANLLVLILEIIRLGEWGGWIFRSWGLYYLLTALLGWSPYLTVGAASAAELTFSIFQKDSSIEPAGM